MWPLRVPDQQIWAFGVIASGVSTVFDFAFLLISAKASTVVLLF